MSKRKAIEICKLLKGTINQMTAKVNGGKLKTLIYPNVRKKDLLSKLKTLKKLHKITEKEIDGE
tara:strand:- start:4699 stop:4890 length:192 start_codon:yes stop_codon:yes gene_type:complete